MVKRTNQYINNEDNFIKLFDDEQMESAGYNFYISRDNLSIRCYCEGDETTTKCDTVEEFNLELDKQTLFYIKFFEAERTFLNNYHIITFKVKTKYTDVEKLGTELAFNETYAKVYGQEKSTFEFYRSSNCLYTDNFIEIDNNVIISHLRLCKNHVVVAVGYKEEKEYLYNVCSNRFHPLTSHVIVEDETCNI